ncbi:alpha-ketoglutarate-dependent dioxygenase AlkB [Massilia sp. METH4]|uniref:alpha-ketoglutarate-dependent dioxygenase AlkB n=1 Tax=Massilia sp. METH4 TaxID=3123041 RepID=UPI0030CA886E
MQSDLFGHEDDDAIPGLVYQPDFLSVEEERELLAIIRTLPLQPAQYKEYESRCRIFSYGAGYDFGTNKVTPAPELDPRFHPLRRRVADWLGMAAAELDHLLVTEYAPGTQLGWHRDVPQYETVAGISLGSAAVMGFRRYPPDKLTNRQWVKLDLAPRSIYKLDGVARWEWQHSIPPVRDLRWSITLRTRRLAVPAH